MRPEILEACAGFRLSLPRSLASGHAGDKVGRGTGSSVEFIDFREYVPGDDLRHVDWRSYARTDQLHVRLFREEVAPRVDIVLDASASMASTAAKARALRDLGLALAVWARDSGSTARWLAAGGAQVADPETLALAGAPEGLLPEEPLRPRGLRAVVSDFLAAGDPALWLRRLAAGAAHLYVIHLLDPWELAPTSDGPHTLVDCETGERADVDLSAGVIASYRERLQRLIDGVRECVQRLSGTYALVPAGPPRAMFREHLLPQGLLEPDA